MNLAVFISLAISYDELSSDRDVNLGNKPKPNVASIQNNTKQIKII